MVDTSSECYCLCQLDGYILDRHLHMPFADMTTAQTAEYLPDLFPPPYQSQIEALFKQASTSRSIVSCELDINFTKTSTYNLRVAVTPLKIQDEENLLVCITDITSLRQQAEQLRQREAQYRLLSETMADYALSVIITPETAASDWSIEWIIGAFKSITGLEPDPHYVREHWQEIVHPEDYDVLTNTFRLVAQSGKKVHQDIRVRGHDGSYRWIRQVFALDQSPDNQPVRVLCAGQDIHEQRQAEYHLLVAKEQAESANKAKAAFLANMSHELRTPLTAILGYTELMMEDVRDGITTTIEQDLQKVYQAATHLFNVITDLLDMARIETGDIYLNPTYIDLQKLIQHIIGSIRHTVAKNNNILEANLPHDVEMMYSDQAKLRQILTNLLSNAAKFTENGRIIFDVHHTMVEDEPWLVFEVSDTGIGIEPDKLSKIFEVFEQGDNSSTRRHGGTGIGLALSQFYANMLQGYITVKSKPGKGSAFSLHLPVHLRD